jgi:hypothetical protein
MRIWKDSGMIVKGSSPFVRLVARPAKPIEN